MTKIEILQSWYDEVWSKGNLDVIDHLLVPNITANGVLTSIGLTREEFRDLVVAVRGLLQSINVTLKQTVEQGDWLAALTEIQAKRDDNGEPVSISSQVMVRFEGNRLAETHYQFDFFTMFEQLGQLPTDSLPICLTGQRLVWK